MTDKAPSIVVVSPSAAASAPSHPDHARWVKDITLKRESENAASARQAETNNLANLLRLDARRRMNKPKAKKPKQKSVDREITHADLIKAGVTKKAPKIRPVPKSPCGFCGTCQRCRREARASAIFGKARQGDQRAHHLALEMVAIMFAAQQRKDYRDHIGRELPFSRLLGHDRAKAVTSGVEAVCDRSTSFMGEWRK